MECRASKLTRKLTDESVVERRALATQYDEILIFTSHPKTP